MTAPAMSRIEHLTEPMKRLEFLTYFAPLLGTLPEFFLRALAQRSAFADIRELCALEMARREALEG